MKWSYCTFGWGGECGLSCRGVVSDLARGAGQMSVAVFSLGEASHKICWVLMAFLLWWCCITFYCLIWRPQTDVWRSTVSPSSFLPPKKKENDWNETKKGPKRDFPPASDNLQTIQGTYADWMWWTVSPEPDSMPCFLWSPIASIKMHTVTFTIIDCVLKPRLAIFEVLGQQWTLLRVSMANVTSVHITRGGLQDVSDRH